MRWAVVPFLALLSCQADPEPEIPNVPYAARPANPTCLAPARPVQDADVSVVKAFELSWQRATSLTQPPGDSDWWWVTTASGQIRRFRDVAGQAEDELVFRVPGVNANPSEGGLLGLAFHPDFEQNGYVYLNYTAGDLETVVERYTSADGATLDPASVREILVVDQPFNNHNGGHLAFGPEGYLYFGLGDGGSTGDPGQNAQNVDTLLGSMLRIDVDSADPYAIPPSNPLLKEVGAARSTPGDSATRGGSPSIARLASCGSAMSGKTGSRKSTWSNAGATTAGTS